MAQIKPSRRRGHTRISSRNQITLPVAALADARLTTGDELRVDVERDRIVLTPVDSLRERRLKAIEATAGALTGVYPTDSLARLRDEWR